MKEVKAIIQPFKLSEVVSALKNIEGLPGITVSEVKGFGRTRGAGARDVEVSDFIEYVKKIKLELVINDGLTEAVVEAIQSHAHTGSPGDGKIFISTVDDVVRVSTAERGPSAI